MGISSTTENTLLAVSLVAIWVIWLVALVDVARRPASVFEADDRRKPPTFWLVLLTGFIGGLYYLVAIRPHLRQQASDG